ncbi:unnamed protein product [Ambrosiozyma monospora]|uniref:Unnamed protein product n=1 Tax=Ambrosiozyma monospora TaxID=43982 RepID=A0A9W6Z5Q9_AMBMO|nr:unnamed protein product [Ambrosiozyma monospora]
MSTFEDDEALFDDIYDEEDANVQSSKPEETSSEKKDLTESTTDGNKEEPAPSVEPKEQSQVSNTNETADSGAAQTHTPSQVPDQAQLANMLNNNGFSADQNAQLISALAAFNKNQQNADSQGTPSIPNVPGMPAFPPQQQNQQPPQFQQNYSQYPQQQQQYNQNTDNAQNGNDFGYGHNNNNNYNNNNNHSDMNNNNSKKDAGKMFIGGLNWETTEEGLKEYFSQYGEVVDLNIMRDTNSGRSRESYW